jgi:CrcB protein
MKIAISIALGGGSGALARYYLSKLISEHVNIVFPFGTLIVNIIGSFLIGFFYGLFDSVTVPTEVKTFVTIGVIGGFTTFSTFAMETINLLRAGEALPAALNLVISNAGGLLFAFLGLVLAQLLFKKGGVA